MEGIIAFYCKRSLSVFFIYNRIKGVGKIEQKGKGKAIILQ